MSRPKLAALGGKYAEILAVYDEVTGNLLLAEPSTGTVLPVPLTTVAFPTSVCITLLLPGCTICSRQPHQPSDWEEGDTGDPENAS